MAEAQKDNVPVRVYQTEDHIMIAAPMPGLEPVNISVRIEGNKVTLRGEERGPRQHNLDLLMAEWTIGPYYREVTLPQRVNGKLSNASYGNGVLVLSMPRAQEGQTDTDVEFTLATFSPAHGEHVGHSGQGDRLQEVTTEEHRARMGQAGRGSIAQ